MGVHQAIGKDARSKLVRLAANDYRLLRKICGQVPEPLGSTIGKALRLYAESAVKQDQARDEQPHDRQTVRS